MNDQIEALIDRYGMSKFLFAVSEICYEKAQHVAVNWQCTTLAKEWCKDGNAIEKIASRVRSN
jgi:hypothetical protein